MFTGISGFISGVILLYFCAEFINSSPYSLKNAGFLISIILLAAAAGLVCTGRRYRTFLYAGFALIMGFCYAYHACFQLKDAIIPAQYDNQNLVLLGYLCGLPRQSEFSYSAEFCISSLSTESGQALRGEGYKAYLRWPLDVDISRNISVLQVRSRHPRATVNFVGSPYESNLFYKGIILSGKVRQTLEVHSPLVLSTAQRIRYYYHQLRLHVAALSERLLETTSHHGMLRALLLGDRSRLSVSDHKLLGQTGTQHLIAISGLHVGIVMLGLYLLLPKSAMALVLIATLGGIYVLLVGFGPSAQRAWVMCLLGLLYAAGYLRQGKWRIYLLALFLVLLIDPLAPLNLGFWFSFICVAILLLITQNMRLAEHPWLASGLLQFFVMLGLTPLSSYLGLHNGLANILANMIAIPWISIVVLPLSLIGFLLALISYGWAESLFSLAIIVFELLDGLLEMLMVYLSSLNLFRQVWLFESHVLLNLCYLVCFLALLVLFRFSSVRVLTLLALLLTVIYPGRLQEPLNEFLVFDSGQGLAVAMNFEDQTWLYDTGPAYSRYSTVDQIILPYLRARQLDNRVSGLIVSHGDADHAGDLASLLQASDIPNLLSGEPERLASQRRFQSCRAGMLRQARHASVEVLYPLNVTDRKQAEMRLDKPSFISSNNRSCVVRFRLFEKTFLLMGDLEAEAEMELVNYYRDQLKSDVLIAGHHGAPKGSSYALLKHVLPDYVVFSAAYLNAFGHPAEAVLERSRHFSVKTYNTAISGALRFEVDAATREIKPVEARKERAAFWLSQPVDE